jgi:hypothetical protein
VVVGIGIVGLVVLGLLPRPQLAGPAAPVAAGQPNASVRAAAPTVGLTILTSDRRTGGRDQDVVVIGTAPPGLTITQDISFGLDQHRWPTGPGTGRSRSACERRRQQAETPDWQRRLDGKEIRVI